MQRQRLKKQLTLMKNKFLTLFLVLILIGILIFIGNIFLGKTNSENLASPVGKNMLQTVGIQKTTPTPTLTPTPIQYNFNKSTDLKGKLDTINPEVLDNDFDNLKTITSQL